MRVNGFGSRGTTWHMTGWADPTVRDVVLILNGGERVRVPAGGAHLDAGFVVFAVALPEEATVLVVEGYDAEGNRVGYHDTRGLPGLQLAGLTHQHRRRA